jgi:soluble lytic murein transglycosylase-like protein
MCKMIERALRRFVLYTLCALALLFGAYVAAILLTETPSASPQQTSSAQTQTTPKPSHTTKKSSTNPYIAMAQADAIDAGIPADLFVRQINQESGFNPNALSPAGAQGIAQFMPATAQGLGIDPWNPVQALQGAANLMARYQHNYGGDYAKALAAYNGGSTRLAWAMQQCGNSWLSCEPPETQRYVHLILNS